MMSPDEVERVNACIGRLEARIEALEKALRRLVEADPVHWDAPYDGERCFYCRARQGHIPRCPWDRARTLLSTTEPDHDPR